MNNFKDYMFMTYKETKQYGAHSIIYTTFYGYGHYIANDREENDVTGNEFFTEEEAKQRDLKAVHEFAEFAEVSPRSPLALMYLCFRAGMESGTKLGYDLARLEFGNGSPTDSQRGGNA